MHSRLATRPFLRSYVFIAAGILITALVLDSLLLWLLPGDRQSTADSYASEFAMVELLLTRNGTDAGSVSQQFTTLEAQLAQTLGAPITLYERTDMASQQTFFDNLSGGQIVSYRDTESREFLHRMLPASGQVIALGPLPEQARSVAAIEIGVIASYYVLVALLLFLWIRPFYRDLSTLRLAATQFGRDDFQTRVSVASNSSIFPVAQSFNKMAERIQYLVTAHRDLTNAVAHELRTPLARFKFAMEMIPKIRDEARLSEHLNAMKTDVQELEVLIDEMLSYAKLSEENLQLQLQAITIGPWLQRQLAQYAHSPIPVVLQLHTDHNTDAVQFNSDLMARAVHNIVRNCLRYANSQVTVSCHLHSGTTQLVISDDGPGIADQYHESIFEPFARLDTSRDRQSGGYGLGLAIARRILQRHGGNIYLQNSARPGASFVLHWPYN